MELFKERLKELLSFGMFLAVTCIIILLPFFLLMHFIPEVVAFVFLLFFVGGVLYYLFKFLNWMIFEPIKSRKQ